MTVTLYTVPEVARTLKVSVATVRRRVRAGEFDVVLAGRQHRITAESMRNYITRNTRRAMSTA